jgi:hypothetical protein
MLDREQLFLTDVGKSACEAAARANMSHEWRLAFGGQLLQTNSLGETDTKLLQYACAHKHMCIGIHAVASAVETLLPVQRSDQQNCVIVLSAQPYTVCCVDYLLFTACAVPHWWLSPPCIGFYPAE